MGKVNCPCNGTEQKNNYYNYNNNNPQNNGNPFIFETLSDLNKRFDKLENEIKEESKNIKKRIEEMKSRL